MQTGTELWSYTTPAEMKNNHGFWCLCTGIFLKVGGILGFYFGSKSR